LADIANALENQLLLIFKCVDYEEGTQAALQPPSAHCVDALK